MATRRLSPVALKALHQKSPSSHERRLFPCAFTTAERHEGPQDTLVSLVITVEALKLEYDRPPRENAQKSAERIFKLPGESTVAFYVTAFPKECEMKPEAEQEEEEKELKEDCRQAPLLAQSLANVC